MDITPRKGEYQWVLPNVTEMALAKSFASSKIGAVPPAMAMPIRSDWVAGAANDLTEAALKLARIHGWLQLDAPVDRARFPYHLALQDTTGGRAITGGTVREGQDLKLVLTADLDRLRSAVDSGSLGPQWVYIFCIDRDGTSKILYPREGQGDVRIDFL